jgi:hypothetical protein
MLATATAAEMYLFLKSLLYAEYTFTRDGRCSHKYVSKVGHLLCNVQALATWLRSCWTTARLTWDRVGGAWFCAVNHSCRPQLTSKLVHMTCVQTAAHCYELLFISCFVANCVISVLYTQAVNSSLPFHQFCLYHCISPRSSIFSISSSDLPLVSGTVQ